MSEVFAFQCEVFREDQGIYYDHPQFVLWSTQMVRPVLEGPVAERLKEIIQRVVEETGVTLHRQEIHPYEVVLQVDVPPRFGIHRFVKAVKRESAGCLRKEFSSLCSRQPSLWNNNYLTTDNQRKLEQVRSEFLEKQKQKRSTNIPRRRK